MEAPNDRLKKARIDAGFKSASAAAEALGAPVASYLAHENGSRAFGIEAAKKYAKKFKVGWAWLMAGEGGPGKPPLERHRAALEILDQQIERFSNEEWDPAAPDLTPGYEDDVFAADHPYSARLPGGRPEIDARAGAGMGDVGEENYLQINARDVVTGHRVIAEWVLPDAFYRHELHATPSSVIILEIKGDSMLPTFFPGDRAIVDTMQNRFGADGIYVFDDGDGEPRVKRLSKLLFSDPATVKVISDNAVVPEQEVELSLIRIIGRVVGKISRV